MRGAARLSLPVGGIPELQIAITRDVAIITVQYRNPADTASLVRSLSALDGASTCELVVVDNAPADAEAGSAVANEALPFAVHVVPAPANLYYWGGAVHAIAGIQRATGSLPRWVIVCNNDIEFTDTQFLKRLASLDPEQYPIIAPRILSLFTNRDQNPLLGSAPGFLKRLKWRLYDSGYAGARLMLALYRPVSQLRNISSATATGGSRTRIYAAHGACVILSSAFFDRGGSLDTTVPMFAEELTLAETARRLGLPIWHVPDLEVVHREHSTTGAGLTRSKYDMERMARRRYYDVRGVSGPG